MGRRAIPFSATRVSPPSYTPLSGLHWKPAYRSPRKRHHLLTVCALLRAPPRGIPGYSLLSGGRLLTGDRVCALVRVPPAQHCIFCLSAFRCPLARVSQGTHAGYPRPFSPMRAFRQLPLRESRRLSERFSSRLCTELQNSPEELVFCSAVKMLPGLSPGAGLPATDSDYHAAGGLSLNQWFTFFRRFFSKKGLTGHGK